MNPVGVDTGKAKVDVAFEGKVRQVKRTMRDLTACFMELPPNSQIVVEATGRYHRLVVDVARATGHQIRVANPHQFSLYRKSINPRAKTDKLDALTLARYAEKEWDQIPEFRMIPFNLQKLKDLLELRETQVQLHTSWMQSLSEAAHIPASSEAALKAMGKSIKDIEDEIADLVKHEPFYKRLLSMDGVGTATAPALIWLFQCFDFSDSDQAVAFVGMDVRVRESGKYIGQRKLTKRGPAFIRRLLYNCAQSLRKIPDFKKLFADIFARGIKTKGANMIVGRKLLRVAFSLFKNPEAVYDRKKLLKMT